MGNLGEQGLFNFKCIRGQVPCCDGRGAQGLGANSMGTIYAHYTAKNIWKVARCSWRADISWELNASALELLEL